MAAPARPRGGPGPANAGVRDATARGLFTVRADRLGPRGALAAPSRASRVGGECVGTPSDPS